MSTPPTANWQQAIHPQLVQRLMRPIAPGVIGSALTNRIQARAERWSNRLPLLTQIAQRQTQSEAPVGGELPIVYAQPGPVETAAAAVHPALPATPATDRTTVIQAKFASSAAANPFASQAAAPDPLPSDLPVSSNSSPLAVDPFPQLSPLPSSDPLPQPTLPIVSARSIAANFGAVSSQRTTDPAAQRPIVPALPVSAIPRSIDAADPVVLPQRPASPLSRRIADTGKRGIGAPTQPTRLNDALAERAKGWTGGNASLINPLDRPGAAGQMGDEIRSIAAAQTNPQTNAQTNAQTNPQTNPQTKTAANQRSSLPLVRPLPPAAKLPQEMPLVFASPPVKSIDAASSGFTGTSSPPPARSIAAQPSTGSTAGSGPSLTSAPASLPSIVREIRGEQSLQSSSQPFSQLSSQPSQTSQTSQTLQTSQTSQTTQSAVPRAEPLLDMDALVDKIERKLARRMAIERERRGWRS